MRLVVRRCKLCCDGYFYPTLVEVDCCVAAEDPVLDLVMDLVLDLVLDLNLLKLALDPADPQLLELLCQRVLLLGTGTGHPSSMSPSGRPGYHSPSLLSRRPGYPPSSSSSSSSAGRPRYLSSLSPLGRLWYTVLPFVRTRDRGRARPPSL